MVLSVLVESRDDDDNDRVDGTCLTIITLAAVYSTLEGLVCAGSNPSPNSIVKSGYIHH